MIVTVEENPTRRWLNLGRVNGGNNSNNNNNNANSNNNHGEQISTSVVLVNGTNIDRSLASYDRYQWLDEQEREELHDRYATVSMELLAEIAIDKPGYLQILPSDGAGSSANLSRNQNRNDEPLWNRYRWRNNAKDDDASTNNGSKTPAPGLTSEHESEPEKGENLPLPPQQQQEKPLHDRLWSTGFSLTSSHGIIKSVDIRDGHIDEINPRSESMITWPNEITRVPNTVRHDNKQKQQHQKEQQQQQQPPDALLVADGFLVPGKDRGGIYIVQNPEHKESEWTIPLTDPFSSDRWFYHKSIWVDLTGDGRQSILTARAKLTKVATTTESSTTSTTTTSTSATSTASTSTLEENRPKNGQLIWLEMPKPHHYDVETGTPLEQDGTAFNPFDARHLPWNERVLVTGPDVTFAVADMNPDDDTIEVLASQFFDEKVTLHSIQRGPNPRVIFSRVIDDSPGAAFGGILVDLEEGTNNNNNNDDPKQSAAADNHDGPRVINSGSTIKSLSQGDSFSHFLVTSHEFNSNSIVGDGSDGANNVMVMTEFKGNARANGKQQKQPPGKVRGGSLLAYKVPKGSNKDAWKTEPWIRTTIASGFQVKQQIWNVINPGAPGFAYAFHAHKDDEALGKRPMIAVAGDCAESAYIFRPQEQSHATTATTTTTEGGGKNNNSGGDPQAVYKLMCEIKCGATVGSIAVGYEDLCSAEQEFGYAKIYIPCFEKDKILVFALGSGEEEDANLDLDDGAGW